MGLISCSFRCLDALIHFFYPQVCLHCEAPLAGQTQRFCKECQLELMWIEANERCKNCLSGEPLPNASFCSSCHGKESFFTDLSSAFEATGPILSLIRKMKFSTSSFLAEEAASFLCAQFARLDWPSPDLIIPVPLSWERKLARSFNQSELLAKGLASFLSTPMRCPLKRKMGGFPQTGLSLSQRRELFGKPFYLKGDEVLRGKNILLIDDLSVTGTTLSRAAEVLFLEKPASIYGLTLCHFSC